MTFGLILQVFPAILTRNERLCSRFWNSLSLPFWS